MSIVGRLVVLTGAAERMFGFVYSLFSERMHFSICLSAPNITKICDNSGVAKFKRTTWTHTLQQCMTMCVSGHTSVVDAGGAAIVCHHINYDGTDQTCDWLDTCTLSPLGVSVFGFCSESVRTLFGFLFGFRFCIIFKMF